MITILQSFLLGIVEGATEFLPISSTAHLIIFSKLLGISGGEFLKTFEIAIQSGAIFAVIVFYFKKLFNLQLLKKIFVAFLPTAFIGLLFYKLVKEYLLGNIYVVLSSMFLGGVVLVIFEKYFTKEGSEINNYDSEENISYKNAFLIGLFQSIAIIPGVSRSASTILGGLCLGLKRTTIVSFSFLLAIPTILSATALDLYKNYQLFSLGDLKILFVGFIFSFLTAIISIKFLLNFIKNHNFSIFGWYRIILSIVLFIYFL